jgi:hypothetical protein
VELSRASFPASIPLDLGGVNQSRCRICGESPSRPEQEVDELRKSTQGGLLSLSRLTDCRLWRGNSSHSSNYVSGGPFNIFISLQLGLLHDIYGNSIGNSIVWNLHHNFVIPSSRGGIPGGLAQSPISYYQCLPSLLEVKSCRPILSRGSFIWSVCLHRNESLYCS